MPASRAPSPGSAASASPRGRAAPVDLTEGVELVEHERVVALPEPVQVVDEAAEVAVGELARLAQEAQRAGARAHASRSPWRSAGGRRRRRGPPGGLLRLGRSCGWAGGSAGVAPGIWFTADPCYPGRYPDRASARPHASSTRSAITPEEKRSRRRAPSMRGSGSAGAVRRGRPDGCVEGAHSVPGTPRAPRGGCPTGVASTGTSQASASSTARPKPSRSDGTITALAALTHSGTRSGSTEPSVSSVAPVRSATATARSCLFSGRAGSAGNSRYGPRGRDRARRAPARGGSAGSARCPRRRAAPRARRRAAAPGQRRQEWRGDGGGKVDQRQHRGRGHRVRGWLTSVPWTVSARTRASRPAPATPSGRSARARRRGAAGGKSTAGLVRARPRRRRAPAARARTHEGRPRRRRAAQRGDLVAHESAPLWVSAVGQHV